jgi:RNA polymerase sigma factor (sigma-70 family)
MRALLNELSRPVLFTARSILRDPSDAEEAAQEAMIVLVRDLRTLREPQAVVAFARRIASRVSLRHRKKAERSRVVREALVAGQSSSPESDRTPAELAFERERQEGLLDHLQSLPEAQSEAVVMQFVLGFSPSEIAAATQTPVNTVRSRVRLARAALAARLAEDPMFAEPQAEEDR